MPFVLPADTPPEARAWLEENWDRLTPAMQVAIREGTLYRELLRGNFDYYENNRVP